MHRSLAGLRVLITGASGGLGKALALELASRGARLLLVARREAELEQVADEIARRGGEVHTLVGDITSPTIRAALLRQAAEGLGGLDILINNAGIGALGRFEEADESRLRQILETNFFAPVELTRAALPLLKNGTSPLIVNIGSILGHRATPRNSEYCASKFALRGFTEALRAELHRHKIDVLHVSPGTTGTEFYDHLIDKRGEVPWSLRHAIPADVAARRIVRAMIRGRREVTPNFRGWLLLQANRFVPGIVDRVMRRYG